MSPQTSIQSRSRQGKRYHRLQDLPTSSLSLVLDEVLSTVTGTGTATGTNTSSTTILGPGAIAGKIVKAFGEFLLAIFEKLIIKHRIWGIKHRFQTSQASFGLQAASNKDASKVCRDLVELTRAGYSQSTRQTAFGLIVLNLLGPYSTVSGQWFGSLVAEVSQLHPTLITDFFMELSALIRPEDDHRPRTRKFMYSGDILLNDEYLQSRNLSGRGTIMSFTLHIVQSNPVAARAVVDAGLLEVLVDVASHGFPGWDLDAISKSTDVLAALAAYPSILPLLRQDDIASCWPRQIPGLRRSSMEVMDIEEEEDLLIYL